MCDFYKNDNLEKKSMKSIVISLIIIMLIGYVIIVSLPNNLIFAQQYSTNPIEIPSIIGTNLISSIKPNLLNANSIVHLGASSYNQQCSTLNPYGGYGPCFCNSIANNTVKLPTITSSDSITHTGNVKLGPQTLSTLKTVGPIQFKFIYSYWTTTQTIQGYDTTNALGQIETDINGGPNVLAVVLHYEGFSVLNGVSAALKLPTGFESNLPLINHPNRYDIAFSSYQNDILPGDTIVLNFPITILNNVKVQEPNFGALALHFLKPDTQTLTYNIDASDQDQFVSAFSVVNNLPSPPVSSDSKSTKTCDNTNNFSREVRETDELIKPFTYVDQINPVTFKITGMESLNVNVLPPGIKKVLNTVNLNQTEIGKNLTTNLKLLVDSKTPQIQKEKIAKKTIDIVKFINASKGNPSITLTSNVKQLIDEATNSNSLQTSLDDKLTNVITELNKSSQVNGIKSVSENNSLSVNPDTPTTTNFEVSNHGDAPVYNLKVLITSPTDVLEVDNNGLVSREVDHVPVVIFGQSFFSIGYLAPKSSVIVKLLLLRNEVIEGTVDNFNAKLTYTDITGVSQTIHLPVGIYLSNICKVTNPDGSSQFYPPNDCKKRITLGELPAPSAAVIPGSNKNAGQTPTSQPTSNKNADKSLSSLPPKRVFNMEKTNSSSNVGVDTGIASPSTSASQASNNPRPIIISPQYLLPPR